MIGTAWHGSMSAPRWCSSRGIRRYLWTYVERSRAVIDELTIRKKVNLTTGPMAVMVETHAGERASNESIGDVDGCSRRPCGTCQAHVRRLTVWQRHGGARAIATAWRPFISAWRMRWCCTHLARSCVPRRAWNWKGGRVSDFARRTWRSMLLTETTERSPTFACRVQEVGTRRRRRSRAPPVYAARPASVPGRPPRREPQTIEWTQTTSRAARRGKGPQYKQVAISRRSAS